LTVPRREPLLPTPLPSYPWERVVADPFELKGSTYLLIADYYSRFVEIQKLTIPNIVTHLKAIFTRFGIPTTLVTDNRPQFDSQDMKEFDHAYYKFQHTTTGPYYSQVNRLAERMEKTVKKLLEYPADPYKVLLSYRATLCPGVDLAQQSC